MKVVCQVKLFGKNIDNRLNFKQHITRICNSAANQLHAPIWLKRFLGFQERKVVVNSVVLPNFYCMDLSNFDCSKSCMDVC